MWSIFNDEDLTLPAVSKGKEETHKNEIKRRTTFNALNRSRSFNANRKSFGSSSFYDSQYYNNKNEYKLNNLRRAFRKKYRIARTNLLKLIKIIKRFPEINDESEENVNVNTELIKRLNKVINKIDVEKLKAKKKKQQNNFLNQTTDTSNIKLLGRRNTNASAPFFSYRKNDSFRYNRILSRKNFIKPSLMFNSSIAFPNSQMNFRRVNKSSSFDSLRKTLYSGTSFNNTLRNNSYYYNYNTNLKNPKLQNLRLFNNKNDILTSDIFSHSSSLNTSFNKMNFLKARSKIMSFNSKGSGYLKNYSFAPYIYSKNMRNENVKNKFSSINYPTYASMPMSSNTTQYIFSPPNKTSTIRKRLYSNKQIKKFSKEEKIRSLLRTASNEDELLKAIDVAKNAGLNFEAKLGDKKLQKLKSVC